MNINDLQKLAGLPITEWANTPAHTNHPEPEEIDVPEADVDQSLRRYLNADPMPVTVTEDHTVDSMMKSFKDYLAEGEEELEEGRVKDSVIDDSETMSKEEFAKKHGKEMADEYYESVAEEIEVDEAEELEEVEAVEEKAKPDFADIDGDGDKEEDMKKAAKDKEEKEKADESMDPDIAALRKLAGIGEQTTSQTVSEDIIALKKLAGI